MNAQLLPCPFCGEPPTVRPWHGGGPLKRMIYCENDACGAEPSVTASTIGRATAAWNTRAALAAPKEAGDALEKAWHAICNAADEVDPDWMMHGPEGADAIVALIRRLAAPSKEAGALDELTREQERLGLYAVPQADQQGVDDSIPVADLAAQLRPYADPDCRECDGTGVWMGNVLVCSCLLDALPILQPSPSQTTEPLR